MLAAAGNLDLKRLLAGAVCMAKDENERHERNAAEVWRHDGGWGIAYLQDGEWQIYRSVKPIFEDNLSKFDGVKTSVAIIHARKVTKGEIALKNTHPFSKRDYVFCHNGTVFDNISFSQDFKVKGNTDSEQIFYSLLTDHKDEMSSTIRNNMKKYKDFTGINIILANPKKTFVSIHHNECPLYYTMKMLKSKDAVVISSEKLPQLEGEWQEISMGKIVEIDNEKLDVMVV